MGFKLSAALAIARGILNDTTPDYRYSDADLLAYGNGALRALPTVKPELLYTTGDLDCIDGKALQTVSFDDAHALVDVVRIKNGNVVTPCDKAVLDAFMPGWMNATAAAAQHWMPEGTDPRRFYITPPAPDTQILEVIYVRIPGPYTADADTSLPETITEAVADYMVGMAEARNDESVNSGRSTQFINQFAARLGVTKG